MSDAIRSEVRGGSKVNVCCDCRAWAHDGEALRHSKRCYTPDAQPEVREEALTTRSARKVADKMRSDAETKRLGREGSGLTADEVFEAHCRGLLTTSEAMNRDD